MVENEKTIKEALANMSKSILEYSEDYYKEFSYWNSAANRKNELPYIFKALSLNDVNAILENIVCHIGKI